MEEIWITACRNLEISEDVARPWFERIRQKMVQGSGRFYHNWDELLLRKKDYLVDVGANIVFAVFFQYYEFDGKRNCVKKNCEAFDEFCSEAGLKDEKTIKVVKKLLGDESIDAIPGCEEDANLLQDLDLLVLGSPPDEYKRYRELLRKEYTHLDDNSYKQMRLKQNNSQPSTSREATLQNPDAGASSVKVFLHQKKPFVKFKDDKYLTTKNKNPVQPSTKTQTSRNQILSRKILRTIRKRYFSPQNRIQSPTEENFSEGFKNFKISLSNPSTSKSAMRIPETQTKNEELDDDCVCIDPQPEVILVDDEGSVTEDNDRIQNVKPYEPIGSMRSDQQNINDSTLKLLNDDRLSRVPFYLESISTLDSEISDKTFSETKDCVVVESENNNSDVVVINDTETLSNETIKTRKRKSRDDDSVIFVSEKVADTSQASTAPAFIPLDTPANESHFRINPSNASTPKIKRLRNDLFTSKEQKQLKQYNDNAYNPNKDTPALSTKKRMVIIDGSNVAYHHSLNKEFSVKGLKICLDYFEKMGHDVKAVVPQFRLQRQRSTDPTELEKLHGQGKIVFTPCKNLPGKSSSSYDDRFVLQLAAELDAAIVSNDNYRDLINENPAFKKIIENRVIGYTWCNDLFILPKDPYGKWGPTLTTILNRS